MHIAASLTIGTDAAFLNDAAVSELFKNDRFPIIAGQNTQPSQAVAVDNGHQLNSD